MIAGVDARRERPATRARGELEAGDGREAVRQAEQLKPDIAILDVAMPLLNGIETTRQIAKRSPATRVLVLTMHADEAYVTQILQAIPGVRQVDGFTVEFTAPTMTEAYKLIRLMYRFVTV